MNKLSLTELKLNTCLWFNPKFPYQKVNENEDAEISIGIEKRILYITFLGLVSKNDAVNCFRFYTKPYKHMKTTFFVHAGFLRIYKLLQPVIHEWLAKFDDYDEIIINGHSMGGAIGTLCHEDIEYLREIGYHNKPLYSFVSGPRVFAIFNLRKIKNRFANLYRINYKNDLVNKVPPFWMLFKHVGNLIQIGKKSWNFLVPSSLYNHDIQVYKHLEDRKSVV